jgi:diketogulonate reductase-like aldo/keto reductase
MKITDIKGAVNLSNGVEMPYFGLGTWQSRDGKEVEDSVKWALEAGYRHIDTAAIYMNESGVGKAIRESQVDRKEIFVTSKVWNGDQGYDSTIKACRASLKRLGLEQLDLYLIHWPVKGKYQETWKAMEKIYEDGLARAIGTSNFLQHHMEDILKVARIVPMVNQMECHPRLIQQDLIDFCNKNQIRYEAWSPIMKGGVFKIPEITQIADDHRKNAVQVVLRWNLQKGIVTIPKSVHKNRIVQNAEIFDFSLSEEEMKIIDGLDRGQRIGAHPDHFDF